jgi:FkbM family methyltransferase
MKDKIRNLLENNLLLRPFLWASFIYFGERNLKHKKISGNKVIPSSQLHSSRSNLIDIWNEADGDETHRLNYNLNAASIVFDVGGFEGNWAAEIHARYSATVLVFEPFMPFFNKMDSRFSQNPKIEVYPFGLGSKDKNITFYGGGDRSSVYKMTDIPLDDDQGTDVKIMDIAGVIDSRKFKNIDLIKLNIEGGEFDLLERLIERKLIHIFDNLQIQFHDIDADSGDRMRAIQHELGRTHTLTYQYEFIWENWKRNTVIQY